jgi:hypothetical protein
MFRKGNLSIFLGCFLGCALWFLASVPAAAQAPTIDITAFGEFGRMPGTSIRAPNTAKGAVQQVDGYKLLRRTDCVVAKLGTRLGVLARQTLNHSYLPVAIEVKHPPITGPDGRTLVSESWTMELANTPLYTGWHFGEPHELVAGDYTIVILHDGEERARQLFRVVLPGRGGCRTTS